MEENKDQGVQSSPQEEISWVEKVIMLPAVLYGAAPLSVLYEVYLQGVSQEERLTRGGFEKAVGEILKARKRENKWKNDAGRKVFWRGEELIAEILRDEEGILQDLHSQRATYRFKKIPDYIPSVQEVEDLTRRGYIDTKSSRELERFLMDLGLSQEYTTSIVRSFSSRIWSARCAHEIPSPSLDFLSNGLDRDLSLEEAKKFVNLVKDLCEETPFMMCLGYSHRRYEEMREKIDQSPASST